MAGKYGVLEAEVRLILGLGTSDISDADMDTIITDADKETEQQLHTTGIPTRKIETHIPSDSYDPEKLNLLRHPVTQIVSITVNGTAGPNIDPNDTILEPESGQVELLNTATKANFYNSAETKNVIDYYYGTLEDTTTETSLSTLSGTGTSVGITVASNIGFDSGDYVKVEGSFGNPEITTVSGTTATTAITLNRLSWIHPNSARVIKMQTPTLFKRLVKLNAAIMSATFMVGETYTFATSYSMPEISLNKGVPYPHFDKVLSTTLKQRDDILKRLRPRSVFL